jgi:transposase
VVSFAGYPLLFQEERLGVLAMFSPRVMRPEEFDSIYSGLHLIVRYVQISLLRMAAYSIDLRQKLVHACERRLGSQHTLAAFFGVSLSFVEKLLRRHRTTGDIAPKPHAGGQRPRLDAAADTLVRQLVRGNTDLTLAELCARVADARGVRVSVATMCRVLQRLGLPRKKSRSTPASVTPRASSRRARRIASGSRHSTCGA